MYPFMRKKRLWKIYPFENNQWNHSGILSGEDNGERRSCRYESLWNGNLQNFRESRLSFSESQDAVLHDKYDRRNCFCAGKLWSRKGEDSEKTERGTGDNACFSLDGQKYICTFRRRKAKNSYCGGLCLKPGDFCFRWALFQPGHGFDDRAFETHGTIEGGREDDYHCGAQALVFEKNCG